MRMIMHTVNVNYKLDADVKKEMEQTCAAMGLTMSAAFTIFAKKDMIITIYPVIQFLIKYVLTLIV